MRMASSTLRDEDLAVADLAALRRRDDRLDGVSQHAVLDDHRDHHLGDEIDDVGRASIDLGLAAGAPEALHLRHGHAGHPNLAELVLHFVQLVRPDDGFDAFHSVPFRCLLR